MNESNESNPPTAQAATSEGGRDLGSGTMFDGIAARYDMLNRVMSLGLDVRRSEERR